MTRRSRPVILLAALSLAACGGGDADDAEPRVAIQDTTAPPIERRPLDETDRTGLEPMNLVMELPWTENQVSRDPTPAAATATLTDVEVLSTEAFDRVIFSFSRDAAYPGYQARIVEDPSALACGGEEPPVAEGPVLAVTLTPVAPGSGVETGVRTFGQSLFQEGGMACRQDDGVTWVARLDEGAQVRVLELRDPRRLVVDLR